MAGYEPRVIRQIVSGGPIDAIWRVEVAGDLGGAVEGQLTAIVNAANRAMRDEAASAKKRLQDDVKAGFKNGTKLANAMWGVRTYPQAGKAYDPAFEIRSSEPELVRVFTTGDTIKAVNGNWLAIPDPVYFAKLRRVNLRGDNGQYQSRAPWPMALAAMLGGSKPQFVVLPGARRGLIYIKQGKQRLVIGWLVKQAVLGPRIHGLDLLNAIKDALPGTATARFYAYLAEELKDAA
jgi:hypothetical protein